MENTVRKEARLKSIFRIPVNIRQAIIIPIITIPPRKNPGKIIPPGTRGNLNSKVINNPTDKSPYMIFSLLFVVIATVNVSGNFRL